MPTIGPEEFERLVRAAMPRLAGLATRLCGDPDAAEDILQEALLHATRRYPDFRGESAFTTWLYTIVVNAFRDQLRRTRSRTSGAFDETIATGPTVPRMVADREAGRIVAEHVSALPPRQREALVLTVYEGLDTTEAARVLETTPQNIRVLVHHARTRLRTELAHLMPASNP